MPTYSSQFPDPIVLVTVTTTEHTNVMTVGWTSPVSMKPPILMVSVAPQRFTHDLIIEAGEFGLSILADEQKRLSQLAGTLTGKKVNKLQRSEFQTFPADSINAPLIVGARAWFECKLHSYQSVGDHTVFYGEVLKASTDDTKKPLVLFNRRYYALGDERGTYP